MSLIAKSQGGSNIEPVPEDQHTARCVLVADIGTHDGAFGPKHQCIIGWELPECTHVFDEAKGEEPRMLSCFYTVSLSEKANLRKVLETWRGRAFTAEELDGFDLSNLLGVPCMLSVVHKTKPNGDVRSNVQSVSKLHKSIECPPQVVPSRLFNLDESVQEELQALPEWVQGYIRKSAEYPAWVQRTGGGVIEPPTFAGEEPQETAQDVVPF